MKLSKKSTVVASDSKMAKRLVDNMKRKGIHLKMEDSTRDLGLTFNASKSRPSNLLSDRLEKVKPRILKIEKLAKINTRAMNLFKASGYTAGTWGHAACGITARQLEDLERDALACSGFIKAGKC